MLSAVFFHHQNCILYTDFDRFSSAKNIYFFPLWSRSLSFYERNDLTDGYCVIAVWCIHCKYMNIIDSVVCVCVENNNIKINQITDSMNGWLVKMFRISHFDSSSSSIEKHESKCTNHVSIELPIFCKQYFLYFSCYFVIDRISMFFSSKTYIHEPLCSCDMTSIYRIILE